MTGKPELLDAPAKLPAVKSPDLLPVQRDTSGGLKPALRGAVNSHLVIWTLILTLGPFGLPVIWFSPKYSRWMKILVSSITIFLTVIVPIGLVIWLILLLDPIIDAWSQANAAGGA